MLGRLAALVIRRRITFLVGVVVFVLVAGAFGGSVAKHLSSGGFNDPGSPSARAERELHRVFHADSPNLVLLVTAKAGTVDTPAVAAEATAVTQRLAGTAHVSQAVSYWTLGSPPPLRSCPVMLPASVPGPPPGRGRRGGKGALRSEVETYLSFRHGPWTSSRAFIRKRRHRRHRRRS